MAAGHSRPHFRTHGTNVSRGGEAGSRMKRRCARQLAQRAGTASSVTKSYLTLANFAPAQCSIICTARRRGRCQVLLRTRAKLLQARRAAEVISLPGMIEFVFAVAGSTFIPQTGSFTVVADFGECSIIEVANCTKYQPDHIRFIRLYNRLSYLQSGRLESGTQQIPGSPLRTLRYPWRTLRLCFE